MKRRGVAGRFLSDAVEGGEPVVQKPAAVGAPRPRYCRSFARKRMAEAMPEIVEALVKKAKGGSVSHAKALAELSGLTKDDARPKPVRRRGKTFAGAFLEELEGMKRLEALPSGDAPVEEGLKSTEGAEVSEAAEVPEAAGVFECAEVSEGADGSTEQEQAN